MDFLLNAYIRNLAVTLVSSVFFHSWGGIILRNCDERSEFLEYSCVNNYKEDGNPFWINLQLQLFRSNGDIYPVYVCPACPQMSAVSGMCIDQDKDQMETLFCIHSKAALHFGVRWREHWDIPEIGPGDESVKIMINQDRKYKVFREDTFLLSAIEYDEEVYLLYTVTERQKDPLCEKCLTYKCKHFYSLKKMTENDNDVEDDNEQEDEQENVPFWDRRKGVPLPKCDNFHEPLPIETHIHKFGYNFKKISYPIKNNKIMQEKFLTRQAGLFELPDVTAL